VQITPPHYLFLALELGFLLVQKANSGRRELEAERVDRAWKTYFRVVKIRDHAQLDEPARAQVNSGLKYLRIALENLREIHSSPFSAMPVV
jgi:hypothetical protein